MPYTIAAAIAKYVYVSFIVGRHELSLVTLIRIVFHDLFFFSKFFKVFEYLGRLETCNQLSNFEFWSLLLFLKKVSLYSSQR